MPKVSASSSSKKSAAAAAGKSNSKKDVDVEEAMSDDSDEEDLNSEEEKELELYLEMQQQQAQAGEEEEDEDEMELDEDNEDEEEEVEYDEDGLTEKVFANQKVALTSRLADISLPLRPWIETQAITVVNLHPSPSSDSQDDLQQQGQGKNILLENDDLSRELSFYTQAHNAALTAREMLLKLEVPFSRPSDYFAEMCKSDDQMARIRQKVLDEQTSMEASDKAKKQRDLKRFGKKVQVEKGLERAREKKGVLEKVKGMRRKGGLEGVDTDVGASGEGEMDFNVTATASTASSGDKGGRSTPEGKETKRDGPKRDKSKFNAKKAVGGTPRDKSKYNNKRDAKNGKYGFGGAKRNVKENSRESTDDLGGFSQKKMKSSARAGTGGSPKGKFGGGGSGKKSFGGRGKGGGSGGVGKKSSRK